jgi:hypothetical protein
MRRILLGISVSLTVFGLMALAITSNENDAAHERLVSPTPDAPSEFDDIVPAPPVTAAERARALANGSVLGDYMDLPTDDSTTTTTPAPESEPTPPPPPANFDVDVPAAGAHVSVGDCTDVALTALMPDDCAESSRTGSLLGVHGGHASAA